MADGVEEGNANTLITEIRIRSVEQVFHSPFYAHQKRSLSKRLRRIPNKTIMPNFDHCHVKRTIAELMNALCLCDFYRDPC